MRMQYKKSYHSLWWEKPYFLFLFFIIPVYTLVSLFLLKNPTQIEKIHFNIEHFIMGLLFLGTLSVSSFLFFNFFKTSNSQKPPHWILDLLFILIFISHSILFYKYIVDPYLLIKIIVGDLSLYANTKELKYSLPGITTLTQCSVVYIVLFFYIYQEKGIASLKHKFFLVIVMFLIFVRAFLGSERLAMIEVYLPFLLMFLRTRVHLRFWGRIIASLFPYLSLILLYFFFMIAEFGRSWVAHYQFLYKSIFHFAYDRLMLYYATALNNGAGFLEKVDWPSLNGRYTFAWLYNFPLIGEKLQKRFISDPTAYQRYLATHSNPEFNNPSGIYVFFHDWSWGALVISLFMGAVAGIAYSGWRQKKGLFFCIYPICIVALLETLRIPYFFAGRTFVPVVLLLLIFLFLTRENKKPL